MKNVRLLIGALAMSTVMVVAGLSNASSLPGWKGVDRAPASARLAVPEDRYAMAGGCYALRADGGYVGATANGYVANLPDRESAEPFHFQATALGSYLLYDTGGKFLAVSEGALGEAAYGATANPLVASASSLAASKPDEVVEIIASSRVNEQTGRGASVVRAAAPSDLADWTIGLRASRSGSTRRS
jgi:hypothetical protein